MAPHSMGLRSRVLADRVSGVASQDVAANSGSAARGRTVSTSGIRRARTRPGSRRTSASGGWGAEARLRAIVGAAGPYAGGDSGGARRPGGAQHLGAPYRSLSARHGSVFAALSAGATLANSPTATRSAEEMPTRCGTPGATP